MEHYSNSDVVSIMERKKIVQKPFILFIEQMHWNTTIF